MSLTQAGERELPHGRFVIEPAKEYKFVVLDDGRGEFQTFNKGWMIMDTHTVRGVAYADAKDALVALCHAYNAGTIRLTQHDG